MERLLCHVCCAPCAIVPLERLGSRFLVSLYFYNPNIQPDAERERRLLAVQKLGSAPLHVEPGDPAEFARALEPFQADGEHRGSRRCALCFRLRLEATARAARRLGFSLFTTSLTTGRQKPSEVLLQLGHEVALDHGLRFLAEDFKKEGGVELSATRSRSLGLYRQTYCGCGPSLREADRRRRTATI